MKKQWLFFTKINFRFLSLILSFYQHDLSFSKRYPVCFFSSFSLFPRRPYLNISVCVDHFKSKHAYRHALTRFLPIPLDSVRLPQSPGRLLPLHDASNESLFDRDANGDGPSFLLELLDRKIEDREAPNRSDATSIRRPQCAI